MRSAQLYGKPYALNTHSIVLLINVNRFNSYFNASCKNKHAFDYGMFKTAIESGFEIKKKHKPNKSKKKLSHSDKNTTHSINILEKNPKS